jgi:hypothetical protein
MPEFEINENAVCVNSEIISVYKNKNYEVEISLAEYQGLWAFGLHLTYLGDKAQWKGVGFKPSFNEHSKCTHSKSRDEAVRGAVDYLTRGIKNWGHHPYEKNDKVLKALDDLINGNAQEELFN